MHFNGAVFISHYKGAQHCSVRLITKFPHNMYHNNIMRTFMIPHVNYARAASRLLLRAVGVQFCSGCTGEFQTGIACTL